MRQKYRAYTLIELIMTISLLVIVLTGGTAIFYRSFKSSGISDASAVVNNSLRSLDEMLERSLRYGTVVRVINNGTEKLRSDCLSAEEDGVVGDSLVIKDSFGGNAIYTLLDDGTVSSNSGVIISNPGIFVSKLQFTWYCRSGVNDKINLLIEANYGTTSDEGTKEVFNKDVNLLNSGIN